MTDITKFCPHCLPQKVRHHLDSRLSYYSDKIKNLIYRPKVIFPKKFTDSIWSAFISTFKLFGIVSFESNINESEFQNRHLIFFREARFRGIQIYAIKFFGKYTSDFMYYWRGKKYFYEGNPICNSVNNSKFDIDDKYLVKKLLKSHDLPTAEGRFFVSKAKAIKYAEKIGFPLVVKPCSGSLSKHVTTNINSLAELDEAITVAKQYRKDFIIEKYIEGRLYRATVVGKKHVFVCEKDAPNVVGDGISTVEELVNKKNLLENRSNEKNVTLHKISINKDFLQSKNYSISFIPKNDQKVYVNNKVTLSLGCDVINCSEIIHPFNKKMFTEVAVLSGSDLIGIDFICKDISISYEVQKSAILELNSLPYIDMHENPSIGSKIPVAKIVWDFVLEERTKGSKLWSKTSIL